MTDAVLTDRALNRATLARQLLLERVPMPDLDAVAALVGLQAQTTRSWYLTLWSRLEPYDPVGTGQALEDRRLVRMTAMRGTIHLFTADDAPIVRAFTQPAIARLLRGTFGKQLTGVDLDEVQGIVREVVGDAAVPLDAIADALAARWPDHDRFALSQAGRGLVPLVHVPPRGVWGRSGGVRLALLDRWLATSVPAEVDAAAIIRRYLAAYGPASVADATTWSGVTGLAEAAERLRPELVTFRDERGRELLDLPDAPRPDPATPAPPRFLPEYDNVLLGYADRTRFANEETRPLEAAGDSKTLTTFLLDGTVAGTWTIVHGDDDATLVVQPARTLSRQDRSSLAEEGGRMLEWSTGRTSGLDVQVR
jgi:hypothetical protein